jgi:hypothetical protein
MVARHRIERTTNGWWLVMSRQGLRWKRDEFMYSTRELAEDRLRELKMASDRLSGRPVFAQTRRPASVKSHRRLQVVPR